MGATTPENNDRTRRRLRSAGWLVTSRVVNLGLAFPMSIVFARVLGPSGKGTLTVVQMSATFGAAALNLGLGRMLMYYAAQRKAHPGDALRLALLGALSTSSILILVALVFGKQIAGALFQTDTVGLVYLGAIAAAPVLLSQLIGDYLIGANLIRRTSLVNIWSLVLQLTAVLVLAVLGLLTPMTAVLVWLFAAVGTSSALVRIALALSHDGEKAGARRLLRRGIRYSMASWASNAVALLSLRQDVFLVSYFLGTAAVGQYSVSVTLAELSWLIPNALNAVLVPKVASEGSGALDATLRLSRLTWPLTFTVACIVALLARPLLPIVFGEPFRESWVPLVCLTPGIVAAALSSVLSAYVVGLGHPLDWTWAGVLNLVVNLVLNLLFIPRQGLAGAALASSVSYTVALAFILGAFVHRSGARLTHAVLPTKVDVSELTRLISRLRTEHA